MSTAEFPTSITTQLFEVVSRLATTLTADINDSVETLPVASIAGFPDEGFVVIDNETIYYSSLGVSSLICTGGRGFSGTAVSHLSGAQVKAAIVAEHFNRFRVELIATQTKMGISGSTYTTTLDYKANEALNYLYGTSSTPAFITTPSTSPSSDYQVGNKKYVDDEIDKEGLYLTTIASSATPTPARASKRNMFTVTALAEAATFAVPSGTPADGDTLLIRIKDNGTARALDWNAIYRAGDTALPTTTVISKTMYCGFIYNSASSTWDLVAYLDNF